jgi:hypothetical protein
MSTCLFCRYDNPPEKTVCVMCAAPLTGVSDIHGSSHTIVGVNLADPGVLAPSPKTRRVASLRSNSIALFVDNADEPLILEVTNQAVLGRYVPNSPAQPRVDLAPYGALEKGVSRVHAVIRRTEHGLTVQDLSSSNGSWLNGVKLEPHAPAALKSGDRLLLSRIMIEVVFENHGGVA